MGKIGNDMAVENADITLLSDGIAEIPRIIKFSRKTMTVIKTNMGISLTVSALAITASAFGLLDPVSGALLHNLSSIFVVSNSGQTPWRAQGAPAVGTAFLTVITRRGYNRAFTRLFANYWRWEIF